VWPAPLERSAGGWRAVPVDELDDDAVGVGEWWTSVGPLLDRILDRDTYPLATRIGTAAGTEHGSAHDPAHAYRFGLERTLDGIGALIDPHAGRN
jgi:hypothetical protein